MPRLRKMIKSFPFDETRRKDMVDLDSGVRLRPEKSRLELKTVGGVYPTTLDLHARTWLTTPTGCRKWSGFFAVVTHFKASDGTVLTDVRYRLNDGTDDRYWNSGAATWSLASSNNWNTEQEVADNIDKWPSQSLQIVINLITTDETVSPFVEEIRLLFDTDMVFLKEYLGSLILDLRENLRPISLHRVRSTGQTSINLSLLQTPYNIIDVDSTYNNTADSKHFDPLSGTSYDTGTKILSIPAQPTGDIIEVRFIWSPEVILRQSQDFTEIAKIPVVMIEDTGVTKNKLIFPEPYVINKGTGAGFKFEKSYQGHIRLPLLYITSSDQDLHALSEEFDRYFANTNLLRARDQDEKFSYSVGGDGGRFDDKTFLSPKDVHSAGFTYTILNAVFYSEDAKSITGVLNFSAASDGNVRFSVSTDTIG